MNAPVSRFQLQIEVRNTRYCDLMLWKKLLIYKKTDEETLLNTVKFRK